MQGWRGMHVWGGVCGAEVEAEVKVWSHNWIAKKGDRRDAQAGQQDGLNAGILRSELPSWTYLWWGPVEHAVYGAQQRAEGLVVEYKHHCRLRQSGQVVGNGGTHAMTVVADVAVQAYAVAEAKVESLRLELRRHIGSWRGTTAGGWRDAG